MDYISNKSGDLAGRIHIQNINPAEDLSNVTQETKEGICEKLYQIIIKYINDEN